MAENKAPTQEEHSQPAEYDTEISVKWTVFHSNYDRIVDSTKQAVVSLARKTFSKKLISSEKLTVALNCSLSEDYRASAVVLAVLDKIHENDINFDKFLLILNEMPSLHDLRQSLQQALDERGRGCDAPRQGENRNSKSTWRTKSGSEAKCVNNLNDSGISGVTNSETVDFHSEETPHSEVGPLAATLPPLSHPVVGGKHALLDQPVLALADENDQDQLESGEESIDYSDTSSTSSTTSSSIEPTENPSVFDDLKQSLAGGAATAVIPFVNQLSGDVYSSNKPHGNEPVASADIEHYPTPETQQPPPETDKMFTVGPPLHKERPPVQTSVLKKFDEVKEEYLEEAKLKDKVICDLKNKVSLMETQLNQKAQELYQKEQELKKTKAELKKTVSEKDQEITYLNEQIQQKEDAINNLTSRLSKKEQENQRLRENFENEIQELKKQLSEQGDKYSLMEKTLTGKKHKLEKRILKLKCDKLKLYACLKAEKSRASALEAQVIKQQLKDERMKCKSETMKRENCEREIERLTSQLSIASSTTSSGSNPGLLSQPSETESVDADDENTD